MDNELQILQLADHYEKFTENDASAYLIINEKMQDHKCLFGFAQLSDSIEDNHMLFEKLEQRAKELGYKELVGPVNYCSWMSYRWAISNFETKLFPDCDNPPHYPEQLKQLGYHELYTYRSASIDMDNPMYHAGAQLYEQKLAEGFTFEFYDNNTAYALADDIFEISQEAFRGSYLYCDIPREYFNKLYLSWTKGLKLAVFAAFHEGRPIGYVMGYDSPYGDCFVSKTSAVLPEYRKHKIYSALLYLGWKYVIDRGYTEMMYHFQCEQKDIFRRFDNNVESNEKRYAVFIKEL